MTTKAELESRLGKLEGEVEGKQDLDLEQKKEDTRSKIALIFTWAYLLLVAVILIGAPIYNAYFDSQTPINIKDVLLAVTGSVGTSFGFVLGYYFKGTENNK